MQVGVEVGGQSEGYCSSSGGACGVVLTGGGSSGAGEKWMESTFIWEVD